MKTPALPTRRLRGPALTVLVAALTAAACSSPQQVTREDDDLVRTTAPAPPGTVVAREEVADGLATAETSDGYVQLGKFSASRQAMVVTAAPVETVNRENYGKIVESGIKVTRDEPVSTFSIDVDTGAYSNVRRMLTAGTMPPSDAVRVEELINYFKYDYPLPEDTSTPFRVTTELAAAPWRKDSLLLHIGVQSFATPAHARPASNLVFLLDVSGSMNSPDKLPLLKDAFSLLTDNLDQRDSVAIVVYAGASGVVLPPTPGDRGDEILAAIQHLRAGGSTNGAAGIKLAYQLAREAFVEGGINRIVLATDGDFNVGLVNFAALKDLVAREREGGVSLTTLGFGSGNYNDHLMEQLADVGNGHYAYIDNHREARKVLVDELSATLQTVAKDVKIQVEFNPAEVAEYRLIGYANRTLATEDFKNDKVDAGEIGAGHSVTALYEITPTASGFRHHSERRYQDAGAPHRSAHNGELAFVKLRYKQPDGERSQLLEFPVAAKAQHRTSPDFRFAAAVAAFGEQLRGGRYLNGYTLAQTYELAASARGGDQHGYRSEFLELINRASELGDRQLVSGHLQVD